MMMDTDIANREEDEQTTDTNVFQQIIHTKIHL